MSQLGRARPILRFARLRAKESKGLCSVKLAPSFCSRAWFWLLLFTSACFLASLRPDPSATSFTISSVAVAVLAAALLVSPLVVLWLLRLPARAALPVLPARKRRRRRMHRKASVGLLPAFTYSSAAVRMDSAVGNR